MNHPNRSKKTFVVVQGKNGIKPDLIGPFTNKDVADRWAQDNIRCDAEYIILDATKP